ncbi:MAG: hypothetical protein CVV27_15310 [Candidatus Melainabacteria bacterium HGW-Melainabacteria-1]|nr:MAG: hypothetical protein CVV27_15310 [Candidatus Melainabacteria bacterium HGW-Melainabacteria-1]
MPNLDTRRLDFLESQTAYGLWIARPSTTGRGYRLHTTSRPEEEGARKTVREAIDYAMGSQSSTSEPDGDPRPEQRRELDREMMKRVDSERIRQDRKFGPQSHPDGTGMPSDYEMAQRARGFCDAAFASGQGTCRHILSEEFLEAMAESEPSKLQMELLELAAVAVNWAGELEARLNGLDLAPTPEQRATHQALAKSALLEAAGLLVQDGDGSMHRPECDRIQGASEDHDCTCKPEAPYG